jgi:geranylgeranyl reductase family protein
MEMYDVIVVGAGPAGSAAAYFLGEAGKRVLVIEKERLPRYKLCGGGLSLRFLRQQFPFSFEPVINNTVRAITYIYGRDRTTVPLAPGAISMVMRAEFDHHLLRHTRAEVIQGAAVKTVTELPDRVAVQTHDGSTYSAPYLIAADGANSVVARALGLRARRVMAAAIEAEAAVPPETLQRFGQEVVFIFGEIHNGYLWIFPKARHLTIGIGALRPKPGELQATLKRVMSRYGISLEDAPLKGHPVPIYTRVERVSTPRVLLAGDAAGLVDPLTGEGIRFAIKSGRLAAETILHDRVKQYSRDLFWSMGLNHRLTTVIALGFYYFQFPFFFLAAPNPFTTQAIVEMMADRKSTVRFFIESLLTLPIFALTELVARGLIALRQVGIGAQNQAAHLPARRQPAHSPASRSSGAVKNLKPRPWKLRGV